MAYISNTWNYGAYKKKVDWPDTLGRRERPREHPSENLDDAIAECGGLRSLAAELRESLDEMDRKRRSGKGFETSLPKRIRRRIDETLLRLDAAMAALGAGDGKP